MAVREQRPDSRDKRIKGTGYGHLIRYLGKS